MSLSPFADAYDHLLLDLDGCVWVGEHATPRAQQAIAELRAAGKNIAFVTNDARWSPEEFVRRLWGHGIQAALEEIVTSGGAVQHVLAERYQGASAVVIGSPAVHRHVRDAGVRTVNGTDLASRASVVVVSGHDAFDFLELREATLALHGGAALLATDRDVTFPTPAGPCPGTGAILAAVEAAGSVHAETVGKPAPQLFQTALDRLPPGRALVIGDRLDADIEGAAAAGLDSALVLSGVTGADQAAADDRPLALAPTLAELVLDG